ncbi:hypothetical protein AB4Y40_16190 [Paraburkholderia sp. EG287B]|uniref:hypothetical protein n=1 Tax=Paraburkholderia sp. EG287B TaxID=3237010 RepID=UPI0034D231A1
MSSGSIPTIIWLSDVDRRRLQELATSCNASLERIGGQVLGKGLDVYQRGFQSLPEPKQPSTTTAPRARKKEAQ